VHPVTAGSGAVPIGRPIANTQIYILDANGNAVPVGVPGELYIGGTGLARGYRHRVDLTAERFVTKTVAPQRLYRTGDLARYRPDGLIECLGRTDNQVKIRGFRVEVEEIEAMLLRHPEVGAAAVKAWTDTSGEKSLAAYVVAKGSSAPEPAELQNFLRQSLPDYMVPGRFVALAELPMTPNRKVDRNALPEAKAFMPQVAFVEPHGEVERRLAKIWREILGVESVSAHDNFFDLGGHSLLMAKLLRGIDLEFGQRLSMAAVFQAPRLDAMAMALDKAASAAPLPRAIEIQPKGSRPPLFWLNDALMMRPLARAIGLDQPFLGVALELADERKLDFSSRLPEIAAAMVRIIRQAQPRGPYYVGGWCTSGILAFEVASQLTAAGQEVGLLVLLHATNPVHFQRIPKWPLELSRLKHHWDETTRRRGPELKTYLLGRAKGIFRRLGRSPALPEEVRSLSEFNGVLDNAALHYVPKAYPGDVVLLQPLRRPHLLDHRLGWTEVVRGEFSAHDVPGTHFTMLEQPDIGELAARMRECLYRAQEAREHPRRAAG
jgi:thioesterase domain-containing protein